MMNSFPIRNIFRNPEEGRIRALWRIILQTLVMLIVVALPVFAVTEVATLLLKSERIPISAELFDKVTIYVSDPT